MDTATRLPGINNHGGLIWAVADLLRGDYKQSEYGRVILPLVVLRRLDCAVLLTNHSTVDYGMILRHAPVIVDTRNQYGIGRPNAKVVKL